MFRKIFTIPLLIAALIAANPISAIEENNGYLGLIFIGFQNLKLQKKLLL